MKHITGLVAPIKSYSALMKFPSRFIAGLVLFSFVALVPSPMLSTALAGPLARLSNAPAPPPAKLLNAGPASEALKAEAGFTTLPGICPQGSTNETVSTRSEAFLKVEAEGNVVFAAPFGTADGQVGGQVEDALRATDGFPPAFTCDPKGNVYLLDAANRRVCFFPREKGVARPSLKVLFNYGVDKVMRDIAFLRGRVLALANYSDSRVDLMTTDGRPIDSIEGIRPAELAADSKGCLMVLDEKSGALLRFGPDYTLRSKTLEGRPSPVSGARGELFLATEADGTPGIMAIDSDGVVRPVALLPLDTPGWYHRQAKVVGVDSRGFLTVQQLMARDIDEDHEYHEYRMYLVRINPVSGEIVARRGTAPFRESPFMVAPRLFVPDPLGGVLTFYFSAEGYSINAIGL